MKKNKKKRWITFYIPLALIVIILLSIFGYVYKKNLDKSNETEEAIQQGKIKNEIKLLEKKLSDKNESAKREVDSAQACVNDNNKYLESCNSYSWLVQVNQCRDEAVAQRANCTESINRAQKYTDEAKEIQYEIEKLNNEL